MADLIITGFERALLGFRDSSGNFIGQSTSLSAGSTSSAYVCSLVRTASYQALAATNLDVQGGDINYTTIQYGNSKIQPFDLILSDYDETLVTIVSGSSLNTTNSMVTISSTNPNRKSPRMMCVALQSRAEDTSGNQYYITRFFPACSVTIKTQGPGFQGLTDTVLSITPKMTTTTHWGGTFGSSGLNMGLTDDKTDHYFYRSTNPIHIMAFTQNASATTFTCTYRPTSTVVTNNATPNYFFIGATATALSSINATTGVATLSAAGTSGVADVLTYETQYVPV